MAAKCIREKNETPQYEAKSHSVSFLKKAARLASQKRGKKARSSGR